MRHERIEWGSSDGTRDDQVSKLADMRSRFDWSGLLNWKTVGGFILLGSFFTGGLDNIQQGNQRAGVIREQRVALQDRHADLLLTNIEINEVAEIANERYAGGAMFVVSASNPDFAISIVEGEPVVNTVSGAKVADGTVVADIHGNTGVIKDGVVSSVAFTGNKDVIHAAMYRAGWKIEGYSPVESSGTGQNPFEGATTEAGVSNLIGG